jgi:hypothetical protein
MPGPRHRVSPNVNKYPNRLSPLEAKRATRRADGLQRGISPMNKIYHTHAEERERHLSLHKRKKACVHDSRWQMRLQRLLQNVPSQVWWRTRPNLEPQKEHRFGITDLLRVRGIPRKFADRVSALALFLLVLRSVAAETCRHSVYKPAGRRFVPCCKGLR